MPNPCAYQAKPLPFAKKLQGISEKNIEAHYSQLYLGYVKKLNQLSEESARSESLMAGANATFSGFRALRDAETFAANAVYLHEYYFAALGGDGKPAGALASDLAKQWGNLEKFLADFKAAGLSMRGWVILGYDRNLQSLKIYGADAHNQGGVWGCVPILVLDVYEHAYYLDFGPARPAYLEAFFKNLNWTALNALYQTAKH